MPILYTTANMYRQSFR